MSPDFLKQWEHIIEDVDKQKIPVEFIKKLVIKLQGKRQQTVNIKKFLEQGLAPEQIEEAVSRKLFEYDSETGYNPEFKPYQSLVKSTNNINMVDPSGGPYLTTNMNMDQFGLKGVIKGFQIDNDKITIIVK